MHVLFPSYGARAGVFICAPERFSQITVRPFLKGIQLGDNDITCAGINILYKAVLAQTWCQNIALLDLSGNRKVGNRGAAALASVMTGHGGTRDALFCLKVLRLAYTGISDQGSLALLNAIFPAGEKQTAGLKTLDLQGNQLQALFARRYVEYVSLPTAQACVMNSANIPGVGIPQKQDRCSVIFDLETIPDGEAKKRIKSMHFLNSALGGGFLAD